jgi:hypothetical protein
MGLRVHFRIQTTTPPMTAADRLVGEREHPGRAEALGLRPLRDVAGEAREIDGAGVSRSATTPRHQRSPAERISAGLAGGAPITGSRPTNATTAVDPVKLGTRPAHVARTSGSGASATRR